MTIFDGNKYMELTALWEEGRYYAPEDFLTAGSLKLDEDEGVYLVESIDYIAEQITDFLACRGDFADEYHKPEDRAAEYEVYSPTVRKAEAILRRSGWLMKEVGGYLDRQWIELQGEVAYYQDNEGTWWAVREEDGWVKTSWKLKGCGWSDWYEEKMEG